ncbi:hypothetical protein GOP47_0006874 [Adiantum capillus-veneris]|uniref:Uncharacterized protein n=1 Tax=Adiantum capillus-veneris TaxID=13818 RepID=A0A9D4V4Q0_ADICA|nr:hypothetical protein GOP47_0006874 [Adiantum capillus-veneris]
MRHAGHDAGLAIPSQRASVPTWCASTWFYKVHMLGLCVLEGSWSVQVAELGLFDLVSGQVQRMVPFGWYLCMFAQWWALCLPVGWEPVRVPDSCVAELCP